MFSLAIRRSGALSVSRWALPSSVSLIGNKGINSSILFSVTTNTIITPMRFRASNSSASTNQNTSTNNNSASSSSKQSGPSKANSTSTTTTTNNNNNNSAANSISSNGNHSHSTNGHSSSTTHNGAAISALSNNTTTTNNNNNNNIGNNNNNNSSGVSARNDGSSNSDSSGIKSKRKKTKKLLKRNVTLKKKRIKGGSSSSSNSSTNCSTNTTSNSTKLSRRLKLKRTSVKKTSQKLRVCVLNSSYEGADSATEKVDDYHCSPAHWVKKDKKKYSFTDVYVGKNDSYRLVRELVTSNKFDVFFNLCDGGRDEKRAGIDVVEALEEHNAAFTGTDSHSFEPSKIDMKLLVGAAGVNTPNFVLLESAEGLAKKCRHLRFPVIVKHLSGYASVGIHKDNRCDNLDELKLKVEVFLKEFNHALVEEFIRGREGTVLACADSSSQYGVKVFKPLMFKFLQNDDDFAYFEKKWTMECNDDAYGFLPHNDPAYPHIIDMARNAFQHIMNGVGYGRVDFRIDPKGDVYFLEINPNCGMWYDEKDGGDFADVMVQGDKSWDHDRFIRNAILRAVREQAARRPWYFISHDSKGNFSTRASKTVRAGKSLFCDAIHPVPVVAQALYKLGEEDPTVGCVILRGDRLHQAVAIRHSCEPNMQFMQGRTLTLVAKRKINVGEELTVDYATLCDEKMPAFACSCGTSNCRSVIFPSPPMPRTIEGKNVRRILREKKRAWYKEKEDREAERMLKKRAAKGRNGNNTNNNNNNNNSGNSSSGMTNSSTGASTSSNNNSSSSNNSTSSNSN